MPTFLITVTALEDGVPVARCVIEYPDAQLLDGAPDESLRRLMRGLARLSLDDDPANPFGCHRKRPS
jgi:hypothetical protein